MTRVDRWNALNGFTHVVGSQLPLGEVRHSNYVPPHLKSYYYSRARAICMTGLGSTYASVDSVEKMNANLELYLSRSSSEQRKDCSGCVSLTVICVFVGLNALSRSGKHCRHVSCHLTGLTSLHLG